MTRKLITLSVLASSLVLSAGCSSVRHDRTPSYGTVGNPAYDNAPADQAVQYGHVRNIQQMETSKRPSGAGVVLGAVVGGVVGSQIGAGTGRAVATAAGAVGGAVVGNKIEERSRAPEAYYQVDVRLDNGETRSFDYQDLNGLRVGDRVRVQDGQLQRW
jgi:outer membrane lipoprotein SlyB